MIRPGIRRLFRLAVRRPDRAAHEMDDEIRFHIDMRAAQLIARGWTPEAARAEATRLFGPFPEMRTSLRAAARRREEILTVSDRFDALRHDVAYALRQVARSPALAAAVVATFALGIGANATMFGIIDRLLLRPPAHIRAPEELQRLEVQRRYHGEESTISGFSYPSYIDFRDHVPGFTSVAAFSHPVPISFGLGPNARRVSGILVSGNYFGTLGARMSLGRPITPMDDVPPNGSPVTVIGYGMWQREFGGTSNVLGKTLALAKRQFTIVGVAPKGFVGTGSTVVDAWIPITAAEGFRFAGPTWASERSAQWLAVVGRVKAGVTSATRVAQVTAAYRAGEASGGRADTTAKGQVTSIMISKQREQSAEGRVATLLGSVSLLVLIIACANVANLLLTRAFSRRREIAVRLALGIARTRLVRQLVTEAVILAVAGGGAALLIARWGSALVQNVLLSDFAWPDSPIDVRVLLFTAGATIVVGLITGLVPALQGSDPNLSRTLREGSRGSGSSRSRTRAVLLLVQAAVSVILLVGTGLFVRSLRNVHGVRLGLDVDRLVNATIDLRSVGIDSAAADEYFDRAREAAARLPGVASVTIGDAAPFGGWSVGIDVTVPGRDSLPRRKSLPLQSFVASNYFATVGTRILRGRAFTDADARAGAPPVVVISESVARWIWPGQAAVGQCLHIGDNAEPCAEVIGVTETAHGRNIVQDDDPMYIYRPLAPGKSGPRTRAMFVRPTGNDPAAVVEPVRRVMQSVVPGVPFAYVRPMSSELEQEMRPWQLGATMFATFGVIALVMSSLGLYTMVAYTVAQRMHEMGVRVALGAQDRDIRDLVLAQGLRVAAIGVGAGTIVALLAGRLVAPMLYRTSPRDPVVFVAVIALLLAVATLASLVPARRAARADPLVALKAD